MADEDDFFSRKGAREKLSATTRCRSLPGTTGKRDGAIGVLEQDQVFRFLTEGRKVNRLCPNSGSD